MHVNTTSNTESNIRQIAMTTTAIRMVARTRMGTNSFPPPDAQGAEPTDTEV